MFLKEYELGKAEERLATSEKKQNADLERESFELRKRVAFSKTKIERLKIHLQNSKIVLNLKTSELNKMAVKRNAIVRYFCKKTHTVLVK